MTTPRLLNAVRALLSIPSRIGQDPQGYWDHWHDRPGIWDEDNAPGIAGTACKACSAMKELHAALAEAEK